MEAGTGDTAEVERLLREGVNPNSPTADEIDRIVGGGGGRFRRRRRRRRRRKRKGG